MIAATATFAVFKRQSSPTTIQVVTILTDLADIRPHDAIAPALPTYDEAVRIATERGLAREPRIGFLKQFGVAELCAFGKHRVYLVISLCEAAMGASVGDWERESAFHTSGRN